MNGPAALPHSPPTAPSARPPGLDQRSRRILAGLADGFAAFDAEWRFIDANDCAEDLLGQTRDELIGQRFCDIAGLAWESPFALLIQRVAMTGKPEDAELTFVVPGKVAHRTRLIAVHAFPLDDGVAAAWRDITDARAAERRLAMSEALYHEIAQGLPAAAWMSREDGVLEFINQAMIEALGRPRRELLGDGWLASVDPDDRREVLRIRAAKRIDHGSFHAEVHFRRPDDEVRTIELYGRPRFDATGAFRGHVGIATDVTEAREAEQRQKLLINELNHRVKNTLAMVQALVRHTLRDHDAPPDVERDVTDRLIALSAAHDVLSRESWKDAELGEVAREVMRAYAHAGRVRFTGARVRIKPKVAIALSMALHELATNAAKYGALSAPEGHVEIDWRRRGEAATLTWRERGGPAVSAPLPSGFGSRLLGRMLAVELGRPAVMIYAPEGLTCRIRAPLTR